MILANDDSALVAETLSSTDMPPLFVVGAHRCATTQLYYSFRSHSEACVTKIKEPNFFANFRGCPDFDLPEIIKDNYNSRTVFKGRRYIRLFQHHSKCRVFVDVSPYYLLSPRAAYRIKAVAPRARIVIILRKPGERAWSHYRQYHRSGVLEDGLLEHLSQEREEGVWGPAHHIVAIGRYADKIERYLSAFPGSQVKMVLYDRIKDNYMQVFNEICRFAEIAAFDTSEVDTSVRNPSGVPRFKALDDFLFNRLEPIKRAVKAYAPSAVVDLASRGYHRLVRANLRKGYAREEREAAIEYLWAEEYRDDNRRLAKVVNEEVAEALSEGG